MWHTGNWEKDRKSQGRVIFDRHKPTAGDIDGEMEEEKRTRGERWRRKWRGRQRYREVKEEKGGGGGAI